MATEDFKRKLTAIFSADVEGYSRLMGEDELATIETLTSHKEIMRKLIRQYRGRVVDSTGDNLLAEFASVVDAVQCAVEVQQVLSAKNETLPENRRMYFRIGINLGDVVEEGERIYGDGVNVAARVESLAEGGGISISGTAYDQLGKKLPLGYEYLGEQSVKNIEKPVRVYRILTEAEAAGKVIGEVRPKTKQLRWAAIGAMAVLIIGAGALVIWNTYFRSAFEPASEDKMAFSLPDKPSIAVLPLLNMSGEPDQDYIADGITENITTALSNIPEIFVIAHDTASTYKGKEVKLQQVAHDLGVRYVLKGSMQKSNERIRVTAQLIDALAGRLLWSEKYDREMKDFFQIMDEITHKIMLELQVKLTHGEQVRKWYGTTNLEVWGYIAKGIGIFENYSRANNEKARELFVKALKIDSEAAFAWVMLGWTHLIEVRLGWSKNPAESIKNAVQMTKKALSIDDKNTDAHCLLGTLYMIMRQHEKAIEEGQKSIEFGPNSALSYALFAQTMYFAGNFDDSIALAEKAVRLCPGCPAYYRIIIGRAYMLAGRYQDSILISNKLVEQAQGSEYVLWRANSYLAMTYSMMGETEKAQIHLAEVKKYNPKYSLEYVRKTNFFKDPNHLEAILASLRKAGLTEEPLLPLPDKPSIAVLPFVNMSGDPEQEYFSDGITESIITGLSKTPRLFVIARNSTFTYKGKPTKVQKVGRELGVRYVLEGSVQKSKDRVRITAQLVDAKTGHHLWAERYDRDLKDIFALQDEITMNIMSATQVQLTEGESARVYAKGTENLEAYLRVMQGYEHFRRLNKEDNARARKMCEQAIALDPDYPVPYATLGWTYLNDVFLGWTKSPRESMKRAVASAQKCIALDDSFPAAHGLLSAVYLMQRQHDKAILEAEKAVALDPNSANDHARLGNVFNFAGRPEEAILALEKAIRLNPFPPSWYLHMLGMAYRETGRYEESIIVCKKALKRQPNNEFAHLVLAATYSLLNRQEEAHAAAAEVLRISPKFSLDYLAKSRPHVDPANTQRFVESLRRAGLPD
jgi:adenylate cyclase